MKLANKMTRPLSMRAYTASPTTPRVRGKHMKRHSSRRGSVSCLLWPYCAGSDIESIDGVRNCEHIESLLYLP
jgi:hypothetical protein